MCERFRVRRLEVFGSAATPRFDPDHSDFDFLVEFQPPEHDDAANRYFGLLHALEDLFARQIDLIDVRAIANPYFLANVANAPRTVLYAT